MLVQFKMFLIPALTRRRNSVAAFQAISLSGGRKKKALFLGVLLLGGLGGCKFDDKRSSFTQTEVYRSRVRPAEINSMSSNDAIDAPPVSTINSRPTKMPASQSAEEGFFQSGSQEKGNNGERATGWTGVYDVYWKLNWARKSLLTGNVSRDLPEVIIKTRKHCKRLADEFPKLDGMDERLDAANSALDHLDNGLQQMKKLVVLEESGLEWRSLPWGSGEDEMHRSLERLGLVGPAAKTSSSVSTPLAENEETNSAAKPEDARAYVSSRQREAIALALRCERENHASPEELARTEFQDGMHDIIHLRDLCALTYHPASVPGDMAVITGSLHLEADSVAQTPPSFDSFNGSTNTSFDPTAPPGQNKNTRLIR